LIVSSEGWSWINSTLLPGATLACTALIASSGSLVATIQSSNVRPPVDADRTASTRTKNASAMLSIWHGPWTAANSRSRSRWSHLRPNAAEKGRMAWQKATGYGRRSLVETAVGRYKAIIGPKLRAHILPAQRSETALAAEVLNYMIRVAKPVSIRAA